jgi:farnesyl diphosphate synthase
MDCARKRVGTGAYPAKFPTHALANPTALGQHPPMMTAWGREGAESRTKEEDVFRERLNRTAQDTEELLDRLLALDPVEGELGRPARLLEAMRYATLGGGKRLRPFLVVESAALFQVPRQSALLVGAALECVHCYSLIHDDLPAMDNDDIRRGRPTTHKAFDEATAVLAGDGLFTFAFDILARTETHLDPQVRVQLIGALARAAGIGGMVGGQMLDLAAEGRFDGVAPHLDNSQVKTLQAMKTGALLRFACLAGAILGKATSVHCDALDRYGSAVGQAFQIADDLLDLEGDPVTLGKATGKDAAAHKATLVAVLGAHGARARLQALLAEAEAALIPFGTKAQTLTAAARFVASRNA